MPHQAQHRALFSLLLVCASLAAGCSGDAAGPGPREEPKEDSTKVVSVPDPATAKTVGFFLNDWSARTFVAPEFTEAAVPATATVTVTVDASSVLARVPSTIFGHNANSWMTRMVDQPAFLSHVTALRPNVIRFPGGSLSDVYFWNASPAAPPRDVPEALVNADGSPHANPYWLGRVNNGWQASVDDYYATLQATQSQGMIVVNYGYARYGTSADPVAAAAHLAAEWVRYDNGRTKYWEVGNEGFGDWEAGYRIDPARNRDGQPALITGRLYAQHFKVFADSMRKAARDIGRTIHLGAVLYDAEPQSWNTTAVKTWNAGMIPELAGAHDFFVVHSYFTPYAENSDALTILSAAAAEPSRLMTFAKGEMQRHGAEEKPVALTEWNMWASGAMQQVSNVSGLFAVIAQGEAIKHGFGLAARWDLLNGWDSGNDHGLFSDGGEPGVAKWTPRPSFHYMYYFQRTMGDRMIPTTSTSGNVRAYASTYSSGQVAVAIVNTGAAAQAVELTFRNFARGNRLYWYALEGGTDNGEFSRKVSVNGATTSGVAGGPDGYASIKARSALTAGGTRVTVPGRGAVFVMIDRR
ncbi:MAG TPA: hypothetical protein VEA99_13295 [Gemmatimonadaceae bacterium]|nr:hypothetical protein [Gemmatimonadaceae bacterium]